MDKRGWLAALLLVWSGLAFAGADVEEMRKRAESSMVVTGAVDIEEDGRVSGHVVDQPEKLPPAVVQVIARNAPHWRFEPVVRDGRAVKARASMRLVIVARRIDEENYGVVIDGASFGGESKGEPRQPEDESRMQPPKYPREPLIAGANAQVFLVLQLDRTGAVRQAVVEQVDMYVVASEKQLDLWRKDFATASLKAARLWKLSVPADPAQDTWSVRVPVHYVVMRSRHDVPKDPAYGQWETYIPGAVTPAPWVTEQDTASPRALADGSVHRIGEGFRLLTPLDEG